MDAGVDFLITQLFFDNDDFFRFRDRATARGIRLPILAGIMPILNVKQVKRFTQMCDAAIPPKLLSQIEAVEDDTEAVRQIGVYHAAQQCEALLRDGVAGTALLHSESLDGDKSDLSANQKLIAARARG